MEWYEIRAFAEGLAAIEQFFIEIAANEERLLTFGFERALLLPSAEKAHEALKTFHEDFSALKRLVLRIDRVLGQELEQLDSDGKLVEQISLISLKLRVSQARQPMSATIGTINLWRTYIPFMFNSTRSKSLFGDEPVSLHKTIINLGRLRGLTHVFSDLLSKREISDDEIFKPSNVKPDRVIDLIDTALEEIERLSSLSPSERVRVQGYLHEAKKEALSSNPSWPKLLGALVIVAAITSGLADAPNAAKNIKDALEYILGTSVERPLQKYLPVPHKQDENLAPVTVLV